VADEFSDGAQRGAVRAIQSADPGGDVGCCEQGIDFGACQVDDRPSFVSLNGNGQNLTAAIERRGLTAGDVVAEGVDRREANTPCPRRVASMVLDMIEKRTDKRGIQLVEREIRRRLSDASCANRRSSRNASR